MRWRYYYLGFSFSLIGVYLSGYVDAWFSVLMRIGIATMIFCLLRLKGIKVKQFSDLPQLVRSGLMYCFTFNRLGFLLCQKCCF
jgi:hypothetical protein